MGNYKNHFKGGGQMILHYIIFILLFSVLLIRFFSLFNMVAVAKKDAYSHGFIIKGRECNIYAILGLSFFGICLSNVIITIGLVISHLSFLKTLDLSINLIDLLIPNKYYLLLDTILNNNAMIIPILVNGQKALFSLFYNFLYLLIGIYFTIFNTRTIYIKDSAICRFDSTYKWDTDKSHRLKSICNKTIFEGHILDKNGNSRVLNIIINNSDKIKLKNLIGAKE